MTDLQVKDIMCKQLITINENDNLLKVDEIFHQHSFHHLPVVDNDGLLVGIISQTDFDRIKSGASLFRNPNKDSYQKALLQTILVEQIMTKDVFVARPNDPIRGVYDKFCNYPFRALPVMDRGTLVGIVTPMDMLHYFFNSKN